MGEEIDKGSTEPRQVTRLIHLPEVQHRVHHPRHGDGRARAHGQEERGRGVAEAAVHLVLDHREPLEDLVEDARG